VEVAVEHRLGQSIGQACLARFALGHRHPLAGHGNESRTRRPGRLDDLLDYEPYNTFDQSIFDFSTPGAHDDR
jgi:hypothetical protein